VLGLLGISCNDLSDFDTAADEAFCGQITLGSGYRSGFSPRVQMRLRLQTRKIEQGLSPGTLSTYDSGGEGGEIERVLDRAALRPIPPLAHDPLSELEFGDGRERNLLYAVSPPDPEAESLLAVLSLRTDEAVEVRLIRPGVSPADEPDPPRAREPLYGLFVLERQQGQCGF